MDLDLDAELLALAGGDNEANNTASHSEPAQTPTPQPSPKDVVEDKPPTASQPRKGVAQKKTTKSGRGGARRRRKDDSEDEADASADDSDVDSLGSGAMDESDSDVDAPGEPDDEVDAMFPVSGKFRSEQDRADIMALPELQREEILAERENEIMKKRQDAQLQALLRNQQRELQKAADKKKRKAVAADLDDSPRKSARAKTKSTSAVESFKRAREANLKERERDAERRKRPSPGAQSDVDAEGESEVEWDDGVRPGRTEELPPDLKDYQRVRVGRSNFARVCFYPGFEAAITGCFARVSVGMDRSTGQNQYRMAQIKGFTEGKPYRMEGSNGKTFWTDQYALVAHGKSEKDWPFITCSDGNFSEQELNRYRIACENDNVRLPTRSALQSSCQGIHDLLNRDWTDADIREKLAKQNKYAHLNSKPVDGNDSDYSMNGTGTPTGVKKENMTQADRLWALNQANRKKNLEEIRKAQIEERRKAAAGRAAAAAKAAERERIEAEQAAMKATLQVPDSNIDDLFGSDISRTGSPAPGSGFNTPKRTGTPLGKKLAERKEKKEKEGGLPTFKKRNMDDDLIGAMDLGIEIDI